jgi:hypothetical protein
MAMTFKDQAELNDFAIHGLWFPKYREFFSTFRVEGPGGLKDKLRAFYTVEDYGRAELPQVASQCLSEKEQQLHIQMHPDVVHPNYDKIYTDAAVQKLYHYQNLFPMSRTGEIVVE